MVVKSYSSFIKSLKWNIPTPRVNPTFASIQLIPLRMRFIFSKNSNSTRVAISLFFFAHGLVLSSWASRIPSIKTQLALTDAELGTLLLLLPIGQISTMPLSAKLIRTYGSQRSVRYGFLLYPLVLVLLGFAMHYVTLALGLFFFGVLGNLCNIAINTQGVELETRLNKSLMSSFHGAWSISGFIGALFALGMLHYHLSTATHFILVYFLVILLWVFSYKRLITVDPTPNKEREKGSIFKQLDKTLVQLGIIGFLSMAIEGAMFDWSGVYFQDIVQAPEHLIILGYTSFVLLMAIGRFLGDRLVTVLGHKKVIQYSGILMSSGLLLAVFFPHLLLTTFAFMLVGLGGSCSVPTLYGIAGKHPKVHPGTALTLVSSIAFLGFLLGPPVIGFISSSFDLRYSFALFSLFGIVMVLLGNKATLFKT